MNIIFTLKVIQKLDSCNIELFCEAIELYPDSILIEDNGIACSLDEVVNYCNTVSNQEASLIEKIKIYPNPTADKVEITGVENVLKCEIFNVEGKLVKSNFNKSTISLNEFESGFYLLRITTKNKVLVTQVSKS